MGTRLSLTTQEHTAMTQQGSAWTVAAWIPLGRNSQLPPYSLTLYEHICLYSNFSKEQLVASLIPLLTEPAFAVTLKRK